MITSLLTILACTAVMAASTLALFYSEVSTDHSTIAGAYYSVSVGNTENETYICPLVYEDKHTFEIKADGTATTGYCKIQVGENIYYTEQIFQDSSLTLTVQAAQGTPIIFTPGWGTIPDTTCGNEIIHSATPSTVYEVEPTARLSSIAAHYGVTEEDILIYNNLLASTVAEESTTPLLAVGMELKIPNPAENVEPYKVPYATYIVEPTATLDAISAHYGISIEDIIAFNDMTTYGVGMSLKIPNADPYIPDYAVPYATYVVEPTATLSDIAAHYGIAEADILSYNNISEIAVGMDLKIPGATTETRYAVSYAVYIMQDGATLDNIALHYGISVDDILYYNNYPNLTVGYELKIPGVAYEYPAYNYVAPIPDPPVVDDTVSGGDAGTGEQTTEQTTEQQTTQEPTVEQPTTEQPTVETPAAEETNTVTEQSTTEQPTVETPTTVETPSVTEQPTAETPTEETTPTAETPTPEDTTSGGEDNGGDQPTEEPAPACDEVPTDTGATE